MSSKFVGFITQSKRKESVSPMPTLSDLLSVSSGLFSSDVVNGVDREGEGPLIAISEHWAAYFAIVGPSLELLWGISVEGETNGHRGTRLR